ncbi:MAG: hypothetical protein HZY73_12470 [Micropruina sp.]|nr:MAG: hypothetical protein HZY73_12470 [Micropruina sp.]
MNRDLDLVREAIVAAGHADKTDPPTLELVRSCLPGGVRAFAGDLDHTQLACDVAVIMADLVSKPEDARYLCVTLGLTVPLWLTGDPRPAPWSSLRPQILIPGRGPAVGTVVVKWAGDPCERSVRDVLAQYLRSDRRPHGLRELLYLRTATATGEVGS